MLFLRSKVWPFRSGSASVYLLAGLLAVFAVWPPRNKLCWGSYSNDEVEWKWHSVLPWHFNQFLSLATLTQRCSRLQQWGLVCFSRFQDQVLVGNVASLETQYIPCQYTCTTLYSHASLLSVTSVARQFQARSLRRNMQLWSLSPVPSPSLVAAALQRWFSSL